MAVDIDPEMLTLATQYFGLKLDERLKVEIKDGIDYLGARAQDARGHFRVILFDVDSKDSSQGMSCPPAAFVEAIVLENVKKLLKGEGMFILNLVCRDDSLRQGVVDKLKKVFNYVLSYKLEEHVNEIFYCSDNATLNCADKWQEAMKQSANDLNGLAKKAKLSRDDLVDLEEFVQGLRL